MEYKYYTDGVHDKRIRIGDPIPDGFRPGRYNPGKGMLGKRAYHNGDKTIYISNGDTIPDGYIKGVDNKDRYQIGGKKHSETMKLLYQEGKITPWNKGIRMSDTAREHNRQAQLARHNHLSSDTKLKISQALKGRKKSPETIEKMRQAQLHKSFSQSTREKISETLRGRKIPKDKLIERNMKQSITKHKNNSFNSSKPELLYKRILDIFNITYRGQYLDNRYPYNCDFYIESMDLFIECNFFRTHGPHPFNPQNIEDINLIKIWENRCDSYINSAGKVKKNSYYKYIDVFTQSDPKKLDTAINSNIRYIVIYPKVCYYYNQNKQICLAKEIDLMYNTPNIQKVLLKAFYILVLQELISLNGYHLAEDGTTVLDSNNQVVDSEDLKQATQNLLLQKYLSAWNGELPNTYIGTNDFADIFKAILGG